MIGGVTRRGAFPGLPDGVTLSAWVAFSHVYVSPQVTRLAGAKFVLHQIRAKLN